MAIQTTGSSAGNSLCIICNKKPKFGNHDYCGRACAAQGAQLPKPPSMCNFCHQKPKFGNHDYCSKTCGSQAGVLGFGNGGGGNKQPHNGGGNSQGRNKNQNSHARSRNLGGGAPNQGQKTATAPQQFLAQAIPHVQAFLQHPSVQGAAASGALGPAGALVPLLGVAAGQLASVSAPPQQPVVAPVMVSIPSVAQNGAASNGAGTCKIPGCSKPVHNDQSGKASQYCSLKHREDAVNLGLVDACILCLKMPRSENDRFCGKTCRDEALST